MKVPVSVVIPIKNEAENLPRCLESVAWADETFVVDSQSTDSSVEIAQRYGAKVAQFYFNGVWPKKRNWALDSLPIKNEWVLILDADEILPVKVDELREICRFNEGGYNGYFINRRFVFMGKWLRHAYYPNWILRLFKHRCARYKQCTAIPWNSGSYDNEAHEPLELEGKAGYLKSEIIHYAFPTAETFITKHNFYSTWEACVSLSDGCSFRKDADKLVATTLTGRFLLKKMLKHLPFRPFFRFIYIYFIQKGFLDGKEGYYFARLHGFYELFSICKTYELKHQTSRL